MHTEVTIERVDFRPFNKILLHNVYVADLNNDTLISAGTISASLLKISLKSKVLKLNTVHIDDAFINFAVDTAGNLNLTELLDSFKKPPSESKDSSSFSVSIKNVKVSGSTFRYHTAEPLQQDFGINFQDLHLSNLNIDANNFQLLGDTIKLTVDNLSFTDKSGFTIESLRSEVSYSSNHLDFYKLRVKGMGSNIIMAYHRMSFDNIGDLGNFVEKVRLSGSINKSLISTNMLAYIIPTFKQLSEKVIISCNYKGTVSDLRLRDIDLRFNSQTQLIANANLSGLPSTTEAFLFIDIKDLTTSAFDIQSIKNVDTKLPLVSLPREASTLGRVKYSGNFTGFLSDFVAYGKVSTAVGRVSMDISLKPDQKTATNFKGTINAEGLNLGALIQDPILGKTSLKASIDGHLDTDNHIEAQTDATIFNIYANDYDYSNIKITGNLTNKTYVGSVFLDDPNVKLNFLGKVDFSDSIPVFDFSAFVPKIDLVKLNLNKADSISQASFLLTAKFMGSNLDNSQGEIKVVNSFYKNQNGELKTSDIIIFADNNENSKLISIKSEFVDGELRGKYNYANIFSSMQQLMYIYIPALSDDNKKPEIKPTGVENPEYNDYIIKLRLKKTQKFTDVISPDFRIAENTNIFGIYNPDFQTFTLKVKIPELFFGGTQVKDITIDGETRDTTFYASVTAPYIDVGGTLVRNISLSLNAFDSKLQTNISWDNRQVQRNEGKVSALTTFFHPDTINKNTAIVKFFESQLYLNDTVWNIAPSIIVMDTSKIVIDDFMIFNNLQRLKASGIISQNPSDSIVVQLTNIDVSNFNFYTKNWGYNFNGLLEGQAKVTNILKQPLFYADLTLRKMFINSQPFGEFQFTSQWYADQKKLSLTATNRFKDSTRFSLFGDIYPESSVLNFKTRIDQVELHHLEPLLEGNVTGLSGLLRGNISITGTTSRPDINGYIDVKNAYLTVDFLKARYSINDRIQIQNSDIQFNNFRIYDVNNRQALLNGTVQTDYFKDIRMNLNLVPTNFQFMNTTERDNELFYGTVYATGLVLVSGSPSDIALNVSVKTEPRTAIFLPLSSTGSVTEHNFLTFASTDPNIIIIEEELFPEDKPKSNFTLNLDLEVTPDAEAQIIIDKKLGDIIKANGSGNLKMEINPAKDIFNMFGDYIIEKGDYLFTLQGVINKRFRIGQGSSIIWNGDVTDALVDIKAIYSLRTTLSPLAITQTDSEKFKKRTPVDCQILLSGKLMEPSIQFNIDVPGSESDNEIQALLQNALNTDEKMSLQFLSLLVLNSFAADPSLSSTNFASSGQSAGFEQGLANTASEMLSNQLSNWLSQWSNAFDIGLNWRPGDPNNEISSNEVELALSTQLFNDRVTINGNVDMGSGGSSGNIAGDFNIDVKIVPSGKIRLKAFARSNDDAFYGNRQSDFTTGAGVVYREDFNTFDELLSRFQTMFKPKEAKKEDYESSWKKPTPKTNS